MRTLLAHTSRRTRDRRRAGDGRTDGAESLGLIVAADLKGLIETVARALADQPDAVSVANRSVAAARYASCRSPLVIWAG